MDGVSCELTSPNLGTTVFVLYVYYIRAYVGFGRSLK